MGENRPDKYRREGSNANIDEAVVSKLLSERRKLQRQQSYRDADAVLAQLTAMNVVVMDKERVWFVQPPRRTDDMKSYRRTGGGGAVDEVLVRKLLDERSVLRAQSDFAGSDALLKQLHAMDVDVIDREGLWSVRRRRARQPSRVATPWRASSTNATSWYRASCPPPRTSSPGSEFWKPNDCVEFEPRASER